MQNTQTIHTRRTRCWRGYRGGTVSPDLYTKRRYDNCSTADAFHIGHIRTTRDSKI